MSASRPELELRHWCGSSERMTMTRWAGGRCRRASAVIAAERVATAGGAVREAWRTEAASTGASMEPDHMEHVNFASSSAEKPPCATAAA
jgi:hypothetical protein